MYGSVSNTAASLVLSQMSLSLNNGLKVAVLRCNTSDDNDIPFACHLDSCAPINTYNLLLHMWILTIYT